ncbi:MAG TPA: phosphoribosyl-AMP cyclohydrolase [Opitutales bacterium]|nr:phosphoribosyl-AMP cyclohydrolase [Opitutales bacterium]
MSREIEEGLSEKLDFAKLAKVAACGRAVLPVVVQHADTGAVLTLAYADREALSRTLADKVAVFWSTSRNELWVKGATSGDTLDLVEVRVNCEQNSLLYIVRPRKSGVCHTKNPDGAARATCYYRRLSGGESLEFV